MSHGMIFKYLTVSIVLIKGFPKLFFHLRPATFLKKRLCFPVNFAKFLRTPSIIEHL